MLSINTTKFTKLITTIVAVAVFAMPYSAYAATAAQLKAQSDYYAAQAAAAKAQAAAKSQQAALIKDQINSVSTQISQTESAINLTTSQINDSQNKITALEQNIKTEEDNLTAETNKFSDVISSWYIQGESGLFETMLGSNTISDVIDQQQYYDSVRAQIQNKMDEINKLKADLNQQKSDQQAQLANLQSLKGDQTSQQANLVTKKAVKNQLLTDANGAIQDLNAQAAAAELKAAEIRKILASIYSSSGRPSGDGLLSSDDSSWYYNQQNYGNPLIGAGDSSYPNPLTIKEAGCFVTSMAMVATKMGHPTTPPGVVNASHFISGSWQYFTSDIGVTFNSRTAVNWGVVNGELAAGRPVIVSVYTGHGQAYNSDGSNHFIVIKGVSGGKYLIHDPWWTDSSYNLSAVISMRTLSSY